MPSRDWRLRIEDILECIAKIERYTTGATYKQFALDDKTVDAVIRNLTIIGEAASHVPEEICHRFSELPWEKMRGMRNVVVHEYFGVSLGIIWQTAKTDLPPLTEPLQRILEAQP